MGVPVARKLASAIVGLFVAIATLFGVGVLTERSALGNDSSMEQDVPPRDGAGGDEASAQTHNVLIFLRKLQNDGRPWEGKMKSTHVDESNNLAVEALAGSIHVVNEERTLWRSIYTFCSENRRHNPYCTDGFNGLRILNGRLWVVLGEGDTAKRVPATVLETTPNSLTYRYKEIQPDQTWLTTVQENLTPDGRYMRSEVVQTQGQISESNLFNGKLPTPTPTPRPTSTPRRNRP